MKLRTPALALGCSLVLLAAGELAASDSPTRLQVKVDDERGGGVDLEIAASWIGNLLDTLDIDCDSSADRETRRMAEHLDRAGDGGRYRFRDHDGDDVVALRKGGQLRIETTGDDGDRAVVEMPWRLAECFLLGREPEGGVGRLLKSDGFRLRIDAEDGDSQVVVRID